MCSIFAADFLTKHIQNEKVTIYTDVFCAADGFCAKCKNFRHGN